MYWPNHVEVQTKLCTHICHYKEMVSLTNENKGFTSYVREKNARDLLTLICGLIVTSRWISPPFLHTVAYISKLLFCFVHATKEDNCIVVKASGSTYSNSGL